MSYFTTKRRMEAQPKKEVPPPRPPPVDGAYHATVVASLERQHAAELAGAKARIAELEGLLTEPNSQAKYPQKPTQKGGKAK